MSAYGKPPLAAPYAHFHNVVLGTRAAATHAKALDFRIPKDGVLLTR